MKVVMIGDASVGKSSIITRIDTDTFTPDAQRPTTSAAYTTYESDDPNDPEIYFCDTAGMEKYRSINQSYYRDAVCGLVVFDVTRKETFDHATTFWKTDFEACASTSAFIFLIGNKCDLEERMVSEEQARNWANANCVNYFETSALSGQGITEMISGLMKMLPANPKMSDTRDLSEEDGKKCC